MTTVTVAAQKYVFGVQEVDGGLNAGQTHLHMALPKRDCVGRLMAVRSVLLYMSPPLAHHAARVRANTYVTLTTVSRPPRDISHARNTKRAGRKRLDGLRE